MWGEPKSALFSPCGDTWVFKRFGTWSQLCSMKVGWSFFIQERWRWKISFVQ